jgi:hypothetical protein
MIFCANGNRRFGAIPHGSRHDRPRGHGALGESLGVHICGPDHPTTVALRVAAETGSARDIKAARALFLRLKPDDRKSALAMLGD